MISVFLLAFVIALIWVLVASLFDIKTREIPDWLNFSLLAILLFIFVCASLLQKDAKIFLFSLLGLAIFYALSNLMYYGKIFGGGDAKLLIALGPLMFSSSPLRLSNVVAANIPNLFILTFFINLLFIASIYGLVWAMAILITNRKKVKIDLKQKQFKFFLLLCILLFFFNISFVALSLTFLYLALLSLALPFLFILVKVADDLMIKNISIKNAREGDLLANDVVVSLRKRDKLTKRIIKQTWEGLSTNDIKLLKKAGVKKIKIKYGMPFAPVFFLALIASLFGNLLVMLLV